MKPNDERDMLPRQESDAGWPSSGTRPDRLYQNELTAEEWGACREIAPPRDDHDGRGPYVLRTDVETSS